MKLNVGDHVIGRNKSLIGRHGYVEQLINIGNKRKYQIKWSNNEYMDCNAKAIKKVAGTPTLQIENLHFNTKSWSENDSSIGITVD